MAKKKRQQRRRVRREGVGLRTSESMSNVHVDTPLLITPVSQVIVEIWRIERRLASGMNSELSLKASIERIRRQLSSAGFEIRDPDGSEYVEGMNVEILDMPNLDDVGDRILRVSEVLRPAVYFEGKCVVAPQVILSIAEGEEASDGAV